MPSLNWIGKDKVVHHHLEVPLRLFEHVYSYGSAESGESGNKIIHGDNLEALKALMPEYEGRIKCIYIDPPYNTGNENWVYNDNINDPRIRKWLGQTVGKESDDLSRHDKWLCMMYPRLKLMHKLLSEDGAIFISIDDIELAHLKLLMDEIFGAQNFIEYFAWHKTYSPSNLSNKSKKCLEYILCYEKRRNSNRYKGLLKTNPADNPLIKSNNQRKSLRFPKEAIESTLKEDLFFPAGKYGTKVNEVILKNDVWLKDGRFSADLLLEANFVWTQANLEQEIEKKTRIIFKGKSLAPRYDKASYAPEVPRNLIDYNDEVGTTEEGGIILKELFGEKTFDYPKTPTLIQYLINFITDEDSLVLDSFAGSGTTAHAVLNLNKMDGGNRKFILIEMDNYADTITAERVKRVMSSLEEVPGAGGGFDYYRLGQTIFTPEANINEEIDVEKLKQYILYTEIRNSTVPVRPEGKGSYLGRYANVAYYFHYEPGAITTLNHTFLGMIEEPAEEYVIYADNCVLPSEFLLQHSIVFKKIPRDVCRF